MNAIGLRIGRAGRARRQTIKGRRKKERKIFG